MRRRNRTHLANRTRTHLASVELLEARQLLSTVGVYAVDQGGQPASDVYRSNPPANAPVGVHFTFRQQDPHLGFSLNLTYSVTVSPDFAGSYSIRTHTNDPITPGQDYYGTPDIYVSAVATQPPVTVDEVVTLTIKEATSGHCCCGGVRVWTRSPGSATITIRGEATTPTPTNPPPTPDSDSPQIGDGDTDYGDDPQALDTRNPGGVFVPSLTTNGGINGFNGSNSIGGGGYFASYGFGQNWSPISRWTNIGSYSANGTLGDGVVDLFQPTVQAMPGGSYRVISSPTNVAWFDPIGSGVFKARMNRTQKFLPDGTGGYRFIDGFGVQTTFYGFNPGIPLAQQGRFASRVDTSGNLTSVEYNTSGQMVRVQRSDGQATERYNFTYLGLTAGINAGLRASMTFEKFTGSGTRTFRSMEYDYYGDTSVFGRARSLQYERVFDELHRPLDTTYYRYYTAADAPGKGYEGALKYVFRSQSYARLQTAVANVGVAGDVLVRDFADNYYEYDSSKRVVNSTLRGAGGSQNGLGSFTYQYSTSSNASSINNWYSKTVETMPDGHQEIDYYNSAGQLLLEAVVIVADPTNPSLNGKVWATSYRYDENGRLIQKASPSAVTITSVSALSAAEANADLVGFNPATSTYQYLAAAAGRVDLIEYGAGTTATATAPGDVNGYVKATRVKNGYAGVAIPQSGTQYYSRTDSAGVTIYPKASDTVYRNADGSGALTTQYKYAWYGNTNAVYSIITVKPVVGASQNGPGNVGDPNMLADVFDAYGRTIWTRDSDGFMNYYAYDNSTGAVVKSIVDVDTSQPQNFAQFPIWWDPQAGSGLNLTSRYQVDDLGRTVREVDPRGILTYYVYNDAAHEVRAYRGWDPTNRTTVGPIEVVRQDRAGNYLETLTMTATPDTSGTPGSYVPTGTEAIGALQTLSRTIYDSSGRVVEEDAYFDLGGVPYSTAPRLGSAGMNYNRTQYGYDAMGRRSVTMNAVGTISVTNYDGLGRAVTDYVGTDMSSPGGNMTLVAAYQYDGGGVGNGNLTQTTQYPDGDPSHSRVSRAWYDFRDRLVAAKAGVQASEDAATQRPLSFYDLDNLGQVTAVWKYDGDGIAQRTADKLRAYTTTAYDDQGRVYLEKVYSVSPADGSISPNALTTATFYDRRDNVIAVFAPGGLATKGRFDGAGRLVVSSTTDGFGGTSYDAARTVAGDHVLTQTRTTYDPNGNAIQVATAQRNHDAPAGMLGDLVGANVAAPTPILSDPGFEGVATSSYVYNPAGSAWTFAGQSGLSANGSGFTSGNPVAPQGGQVAFLQATGSIGMTNNEWAAGTYRITFQAAQRGNYQSSSQDFQVLVDGNVVATFRPTGTAYQTYSTPSFAVPAGSHTITFQGLNSNGGDNTAFIDSVQVVAATPAAPTVGDAGFESVSVGAGSYAYNPAGSAWTFSPQVGDSGSGLTGNGSPFTSGNPSAPSGSQVAFLQATGTISQTISGWAAGSYRINFMAADRVNYTAVPENFEVLVDGDVVGTFSPTGGSYQSYSTASFAVSAGSHTVTFRGLTSSMHGSTAFLDAVSIVPDSASVQTGDGLSATYYNTPNLTGGSASRVDPTVNFDWAYGSPDPSIPTDGFSARWTGQVFAPTDGAYTFSTVSDDGVRLWVNGQLLVDNWTDHPPTENSGTITLAAGQFYSIRMEYFEGVASASARLLWTRPGAAKEAIPQAFLFSQPVSSARNARVSFTTAYYDAANRMTASVDVGTNGGMAYSRPDFAPARSDQALVTNYEYDAAGWDSLVVDPRGIMQRTDHDMLGRATRTIAGYTPANSTPTSSTNGTTLYTYTGLDQVRTVTAVMPAGTPSQTTTYVYGVSPASGSGLTTNDWLRGIVQPNKATGALPTSNIETYSSTYFYNRLGEVAAAADPNGTTHQYAYDLLGRPTSDAVTVLGTGVNGAVRRLETAYDTAGRAFLFTSYDAASGGSITDQVMDTFNGLGQLTARYQEHDGSIDLTSTPTVRFAYTEMAGGSNHSRLVSMTYPNGRVIGYVYNTGLDSAISRLSGIADDNSGTPAQVLESYRYLGLGTVVERIHPQTGVDLSYVRQAGDTLAKTDGGDQYTGLDRFGRVIDQNWTKSGGGSAARYQYGYDRAGNALYRADLVNAALSELYHGNSTATGDDASAYDALGRLTGFARGTLSASGNNSGKLDTIAIQSSNQSWSLDALGNWVGNTTNSSTTKSFNAANQETSSSVGATPTFDNNGNTLTAQNRFFTYDAWNRLVAVQDSATQAVVASYRFDALRRRIVETRGTNTTHTYLTPDWQVIEERTGDTASSNATTQYVLGASGIILRDHLGGGNVVSSSRLYNLNAPSGDVLALVDSSGQTTERYAHSPYGSVLVLDGNGSPRIGNSSQYGWQYLYQGGRLDSDTGLYLFQHRDYEATQGHWLERDPLGFVGGDTNLYRFVGNNPINRTDSTGLAEEWAGGLKNPWNYMGYLADAWYGNNYPTPPVQTPDPYSLSGLSPQAIGPMKMGGFAERPGGGMIPRGAAAIEANKDIVSNATDIGVQLGVAAVTSRLPGRWPGGKPWNTISETPDLLKKVNKLTNKQREAYEALKDLLAQNLAGKHQHALKGDRAGQYAADLVGSGRGRGAQRIIYTIKDGLVEIIDITDYHPK